MKSKKAYTILFSIFLGIFSFGYTTSASARYLTHCRTINQPGLYKLLRNLSSENDCLIVNADHVTIDLNGHVISGTGESTGFAISGTIAKGLHVRNGTITGFSTAIVGPNFSTLNEMNIIDNEFGVTLGEGGRITNSIFSETSEHFALQTGKGATIKDNTFYQNNIHLHAGSGSLVVNNIGINGNEDSFNIDEKALVIGNNVTDTFDEGLRVGSNSNVINNNAFGNLGTFDIQFGADTNVIGNAADHYSGTIPGCVFTDPVCREFHNLFLFTD